MVLPDEVPREKDESVVPRQERSEFPVLVAVERVAKHGDVFPKKSGKDRSVIGRHRATLSSRANRVKT